MSISERLKRELSVRRPVMSTRQLQKEVEKEAGRGTRGTSYASVYEYVEGKGKTEPPLSFLRPAARVLGVRVEFLITGEEPRTKEEHLVKGLDTTLAEAAEAILALGGDASWNMFMRLVARLLLSCPDRKKAGEEVVGHLAYHLQQRILESYHAFNPAGFDEQVRQTDYLEATLHAMALAVPDPGQGVPIKKLLKNLGRKP